MTSSSQNVETDNLNHLLHIRNSVIGTLLQIEREKKDQPTKKYPNSVKSPSPA
jgi:hypothetical protein